MKHFLKSDRRGFVVLKFLIATLAVAGANLVILYAL